MYPGIYTTVQAVRVQHTVALKWQELPCRRVPPASGCAVMHLTIPPRLLLLEDYCASYVPVWAVGHGTAGAHQGTWACQVPTYVWVGRQVPR